MTTRKFVPIEIPKVDTSLIVKTGETSASFAALFNNPNIPTRDPLFTWIQKNINS
jgi:hypothetical protein